jgi:hypothetical protein
MRQVHGHVADIDAVRPQASPRRLDAHQRREIGGRVDEEGDLSGQAKAAGQDNGLEISIDRQRRPKAGVMPWPARANARCIAAIGPDAERLRSIGPGGSRRGIIPQSIGIHRFRAPGSAMAAARLPESSPGLRAGAGDGRIP